MECLLAPYTFHHNRFSLSLIGRKAHTLPFFPLSFWSRSSEIWACSTVVFLDSVSIGIAAWPFRTLPNPSLLSKSKSAELPAPWAGSGPTFMLPFIVFRPCILGKFFNIVAWIDLDVRTQQPFSHWKIPNTTRQQTNQQKNILHVYPHRRKLLSSDELKQSF